jgi:hypothetical protein
MRKFQAALCGLLILCGTAFAQSEKPVKVTGADAVANTSVSQQTAADGTNVLPTFGSYVFNGSTWDRARAVTTGTASATSLPGTPIFCDTATSGTVTAGQAQMVRCNLSGALSVSSTSALNQDGVGGASTFGLNNNVGSTAVLVTNSLGYNGSTYDRARTADLTNYNTAGTLTAANSIGAVLTEKGSRWSVIHNPAAGSQATASIASEASVRHVVDCISFSAASTTAPVLTALTVNVRDGASGAGTIIWTNQVVISAATGQNVAPVNFCGLNLVGTTATAMTVEFSASLANLIESVSISGFNVN